MGIRVMAELLDDAEAKIDVLRGQLARANFKQEQQLAINNLMHDKAINDLREQLAKANAEIKDLKGQLDAADEEVDDLENSNELLQDRILLEQDHVEELRETLAEMKREHEKEISKQQEQSGDTIYDLEREIENLQELLNEANHRIEDLENSVEMLMDENQGLRG